MDRPKLTRFRVRQEMLSLQSQVSLNIASAASTNESGDRFKLIYEAVMEGPPEIMRIDRAVWETVNAVGVRLELDVVRFDSKVKADIYSVAAAVELGMAKAAFTTTVFPAESSVLQALIPSGGSFDIEAYGKILDGVAQAKAALASTPDLHPQLIHRPSALVFSAEDELKEAQAVCFAAVYLVQDHSFAETMQEASKRGLDQEVVHQTYLHFWPDLKETDKPPKAVRSAAGKWLGW